jgi:hypothetical protein
MYHCHYMRYASPLHFHTCARLTFDAHESSLKKHTYSLFCVYFIMPSPLPYHPCNSSSSLAVILSFFGFCDSYSLRHFPSVNFLYDDSSFHWQLSRDSSAPLAIILKLFEFSGRYNQSFLAVTIIPFWKLQREPPCAHLFGTFSLPEKTTQWALDFSG